MLTQLTVKDRENSETLSYDYTYDDYQRPQTISESNDYATFKQTLDYDDFGRIKKEERTATLFSWNWIRNFGKN